MCSQSLYTTSEIGGVRRRKSNRREKLLTERRFTFKVRLRDCGSVDSVDNLIEGFAVVKTLNVVCLLRGCKFHFIFHVRPEPRAFGPERQLRVLEHTFPPFRDRFASHGRFHGYSSPSHSVKGSNVIRPAWNAVRLQVVHEVHGFF
jgi:hypothetical protein